MFELSQPSNLTNHEKDVDKGVENEPPLGIDGREGHSVGRQHRHQHAHHGDAGVPLQLIPLVRQDDHAVVELLRRFFGLGTEFHENEESITLYYDITILQYHNITTLQYYNITILQYYNITILQYYNITILQYYNITILQYYNITILQYYNTTVIQYYSIKILQYIQYVQYIQYIQYVQ